MTLPLLRKLAWEQGERVGISRSSSDWLFWHMQWHWETQASMNVMTMRNTKHQCFAAAFVLILMSKRRHRIFAYVFKIKSFIVQFSGYIKIINIIMEEKEATLVLPIVKMNPQASLCWEHPHCPAHKGLHLCFTCLKSHWLLFQAGGGQHGHCHMPNNMNRPSHHSISPGSTTVSPQLTNPRPASHKVFLVKVQPLHAPRATAIHRQLKTWGPLQHDSQPIPSCKHSYTTK